jgi:predicted RNA-binding Zn ribbon-like protein
MADERGQDRSSLDIGGLSAGDLSLAFANTAEWHAGPNPEERLTSYSSAVTWGRQVGVLSEGEAKSLLARARATAGGEEQALGRIISLREAVYRIFAAVAHDRSVDPSDLEILNEEIAEALRHLRLVALPRPASRAEPPGEPADLQPFAWTWVDVESHPTSLLWPVARAASMLLTSPRLARVRECAGDPCGWLFLDLTKNGSRRWCDMADCGNRAKARRYRERKRAKLEIG